MALRTSLTTDALLDYLSQQLSTLFPDGSPTRDAIRGALVNALERVEFCFQHIRWKNYQDAKGPIFNHLNTDHYAKLLYFVGNCIYRANGDLSVAAKLYALNKALHGLDVFYEVELPRIFCWQHPVGTVIGRGRFDDFLFVYHGVTVGSNLDGVYPTLGRGVCLFGGSAVTGACAVGDNAFLSLGTKVVQQDVPPDSTAFGSSPALTFKPNKRSVIQEMFRFLPS